jgi:hypothetical protein
MQANKLNQKQYTKAFENRKQLHYCILLDETKLQRPESPKSELRHKSYD